MDKQHFCTFGKQLHLKAAFELAGHLWAQKRHLPFSSPRVCSLRDSLRTDH